MRLLLASTVFCVLAGGLAARDDQKADAKKYESKDGKYRVAFPGEPTLQNQKAPGVEIEMKMAIVEKGKGGYGVIYNDLPSVNGVEAKAILDGGEKGLADKTKSKITSSKNLEFGKDKFPARDIVAENTAATMRIRLILADNRLYQVMVIGPKEFATNKDADKFVGSFELTK